jgi:hypothetical protein
MSGTGYAKAGDGDHSPGERLGLKIVAPPVLKPAIHREIGD